MNVFLLGLVTWDKDVGLSVHTDKFPKEKKTYHGEIKGQVTVNDGKSAITGISISIDKPVDNNKVSFA